MPPGKLRETCGCCRSLQTLSVQRGSPRGDQWCHTEASPHSWVGKEPFASVCHFFASSLPGQSKPLPGKVTCPRTPRGLARTHCVGPHYSPWVPGSLRDAATKLNLLCRNLHLPQILGDLCAHGSWRSSSDRGTWAGLAWEWPSVELRAGARSFTAFARCSVCLSHGIFTEVLQAKLAIHPHFADGEIEAPRD